VSLPTEGEAALVQESCALQAQIAEEAQLFEEEFAHMQRALNGLNSEISTSSREFAQLVEGKEKEYVQAQRESIDLAKRLISLPLLAQQKEQALQEENQLLRLKNAKLAKELEALHEKSEALKEQTFEGAQTGRAAFKQAALKAGELAALKVCTPCFSYYSRSASTSENRRARWRLSRLRRRSSSACRSATRSCSSLRDWKRSASLTSSRSSRLSSRSASGWYLILSDC